MGVTYVGCKSAEEISLCEVAPQKGRFGGANPGAFVLMTKNKRADSPPEARDHTGDTTMDDKALAKAIGKMATWTDVTKAHYAGLKEDDQVAFLEKAATEQNEIAKAATEAAAATALAEKAAREGKTTREVELEKSNKAIADQLAEIQKERADEKATAVIEKRARDEFGGFPGGEVEVDGKPVIKSGFERACTMLKAASKLPADEREAVEAMMKSQSSFARRAGASMGFEKAQTGGSAATQVAQAIEKVATDRKVSKAEATRIVAADPQYADLQERALGEELAA